MTGKADLGVLFVHGIGEQRRGQTLLGFGESLLRWLPRWLERSGVPADGVLELPEAWLEPPDGPPHAEARIRPPGSAREHTWLLAESWWAQAFVTPRYGQLVRWSLQAVPWTIASHFATRLRGAVARLRSSTLGEMPFAIGRVASHLVYLLVGLALIPVVVALLLLLLVVGLVPSRRLRKRVAGAQQRLASTVGDSYVLLESPIQEASIVGQVKRDLRWLAGRCRTVAVVAHSQGAAIAHTAVRSDPPDNLRLLLTFGSGLKKLSEIRAIARSRAAWTTWAAPLGLFLMAAALPRTFREVVRLLPAAVALFALAIVIQAASSRMRAGSVWRKVVEVAAALVGAVPAGLVAWRAFSGAEWVAYVFVGGILLLVWGIKPSMAGAVDPERLRLDARIRWVDVHASADPVPNGPLAEGAHPPLAHDVEVHNFGSLLTDHSSYWANEEQFVSTAAGELGELDALALVGPEDREALRAAGRRRSWRVPWLNLARGTTLVLAAILCFRAADLALPIRPLLRAADAAAGLLPFGVEPGLATGELGTATRMGIGIAAVLLGAILWHAVLLGLWRWWTRTEATRLLRRRAVDPWGVPFVAFLLALAAGIEAGVLASAGWSRAIPEGFFAGAWLGGNLAVIALVVVLVRRRREGASAAWFLRGAARAAALGGVIALTMIPGLTLAALGFSGSPGQLFEQDEAMLAAGIPLFALIAFWVSPLRRWLRDRIAGWDREPPPFRSVDTQPRIPRPGDHGTRGG